MTVRTWVLSAVVGLAVLGGASIGAALLLLNPNDYRSAIAEAVRDATGRQLTLNGPLRLSRSLWPTIEINDVMLANLPGGSRADMARAERIEGQLSLLALLWRRIEVTKLTLVGPNILFEEVGGQPNWVFSTPVPGGGLPAGAGAAGAGLQFELRIRNVHIRNGMVTWRLPARTKVVGIRSLDLHHPLDDGPFDMQTTLVYSDNQPFRLNVSAQPLGAIAGPWTTQLTFAAFDTTASASGTMTFTGQYELQVEAKTGALEKLNALLPEMRLPAIHRATLSTHVTNGRVPGDLPVIGPTRLRFESADLADRVRGLRLGAVAASLPQPGGLAAIDGMGQFAGRPFTLRGTVGIPAHPDDRVSIPLDLKADAVSKEGKTTGDNLALKGQLTLEKLRFGGLEARAALHTSALAAFRPLLTEHLPALTDVHFDGHVSLPAKAGPYRFKDAKLFTRQGDLAGDGTIGFAPALALEASLHAAKLDLDEMMQAFGVDLTPPAPSAGSTGPVIPGAPLPWASLHGYAIDITGSVGALTVSRQVWRQVNFALQLNGGRVQVASLQLPLPVRPAELMVTADASAPGRPVPVSLSIHAPGIPLGVVAHYAGLPGPVTGTVRIEVQLRGVGRSLRELAATLDGPVSVTATDGQLSNAALMKITSAALDALGIKVPAQGDTRLGCLGLVGSFRKGLGAFRTIALETTYLSLEGIGQVDLAHEMVAFELRPLAQVAGAQVEVPVVVEGPFRAIKGRLDASGVEKVGLLIDAWFGGDKPKACANAGLVPGRANGR